MAVPGKRTLKYGGNTSCVMIVSDGKTIFFDAGTGLATYLSGESKPYFESAVYDRKYLLFLSHLHYDHIQGFPFFKPFFDRDARVDIYGAKPDEAPSLEHALNQFLRAPFLPFGFEAYKAEIVVHQFDVGDRIRIGEHLCMETFPLIHPNGCVAYKLTETGADGRERRVVYSTDTSDFEGEQRRRYLDFVRGADLLIIDAFFNDEEINGTADGISKQNWGHMSYEQGVRLAAEAEVGRLALFHHLDSRSDAELDQMELAAGSLFPGAFCAYEGQMIEL